jgi:hypothetical protein
MAAYRFSQAAGVAAMAARGLGLAITTMTGPIGIAVAGIYLLAEYLGLFSDKTAEASGQIVEGLVTEKNVQVIGDRINTIKTLIAELNTPREKRRGGLTGSTDEERQAQIETLTKELEELTKVHVKGTSELLRRAADGIVNQSMLDLGDKLDTMQAGYVQKMTAFENAIKDPANKSKEAQAKLNAGRLEEVAKFYDDYLKILDAGMEEALAMMGSGDAKQIAAGEKLLVQLKKQRDLFLTQKTSELAAARAANVYVGGTDGEGEKLTEAGNKIAQLAGRLADLKAESAGAGGELAKLNAQIEHGMFKKATPAELNQMRSLAAGIDEVTAALKRQKAIQEAHEQAWATITDKWQDAAAKANLVRAALKNGDTELDPKGLMSLIANLEQARTKLMAGSEQDRLAAERIGETISNTRFANLGEELMEIRRKTRQMTGEMVDDENQARENAYSAEVARLRRLLDQAQLSGEDRINAEKDIQDHIRALREKADRDNESSAQRLARQWKNTAQQLRDASGGWLTDLTKQLTDFVMTGKMKFGDFAESVIADLVRIQIQSRVTGPLSTLLDMGAKWIGGAITGYMGGTAAIDNTTYPSAPTLPVTRVQLNHLGGIVGKEASAVFAMAQRFHAGRAPRLKPDEVPTILQQDEGVFTPEQMKALGRGSNTGGNVQVNVINQSGQDVDAEQGQPRFDGEKMILDVFLKAAGRPGAFRNSLKGAVA